VAGEAPPKGAAYDGDHGVGARSQASWSEVPADLLARIMEQEEAAEISDTS
jgi:hypothetical protein